MEEFTLKDWCDEVELAAQGVINPAFLPTERRRCERELARLTTPDKCIAAVQMVRSLMRNLQGAQNRLEEMLKTPRQGD